MSIHPLAEAAGSPFLHLADTLAVLMLGISVLMLATRQLDSAIRLLLLQSVMLAAIIGLAGAATGEAHLWLVAGLTLVVKGVAVPRILFYVLDRILPQRALDRGHIRSVLDRLLPRSEYSHISYEDQIVIQTKILLVIAGGLVMLAYWVARPLDLPTAQALPSTLAAAIGAILLGGLLMVTRRKAISMIVGLMVMENGLALAAVVMTAGVPLVVELGVFFDALVGVLVMGVMTYRIHETFDTIDVDWLRQLHDRHRPLARTRQGQDDE